MRDGFVARIKLNLSWGVFERQTATGSKTSSLFICLDATTFILMCHYSYRDDLLENFPKNHCPRMQKVHFQWPLECLILTRNVTRYSNEPIKYIIVALLFTFEHGGFNILQLRQKSKFRKLQIFISQTTDSPFANYRFSFRFIPFRFVLFCFAPFRFANYSKPT